jgi:SAM-dependent methyltransferase
MGSMTQVKIERAIKDRMEIIAPLVKDRKTLDLGVVDSRRGRKETAQRLEEKSASLLFRRICEINRDTVGIDIDADGVEVLRQQGYNARVADVMTMDLGELYEVIIAGELVEHLVNPGLFLRNIARHLTPEGTLVLTTPNPFYSGQVWKIWRYEAPRVHEEHVAWFDPITLGRLCRGCQLEPYAVHWIRSSGGNVLKRWPQFLRGYFAHSFLLLAKPAFS